MTNFIKIEETFWWWTDIRTLQTQFIRSTQKSPPKNSSWYINLLWLAMSAIIIINVFTTHQQQKHSTVINVVDSLQSM